MSEATGAQALLRVLRAMGVEKMFASPGSDWAPLWEALARPWAPGEIPEYLSSRHEETAAAMALGYAKASGKLPALVLHTTVGTLHALMVLRAALHERLPIIVLAGESLGFGEGPGPDPGRQWLRLLSDVGGPARLAESCVKWSIGLNSSLLLPHTIQRACQLAMAAPRGPTFVSVPAEYLMAPAAAMPPPAGHALAPAASPDAIRALAELLSGAKNPVIITEELGREVVAVPHLVRLAETLGAPVLEAWQPTYVNFPRSHPLYGGIATTDMGQVLQEADLAFLVETVCPWHPPSKLPAGTRVAVLAEDPLHARLPFWGYRADVVAAGDPATSIALLAEEVARRVPAGSRASAAERWAKLHQARRAAVRSAARKAAELGHIVESWLTHELEALLPAGALIVNETITHRLDVQRGLDRLEPGCMFEASYGGLGVGIGMALGAKCARPERTVVNLIGDGAFHYNPVVASFGASQEHRLPLLVVLFDNAGYRSQKGDVISEYPEGWAVRTGTFAGTSIRPRPDYAALARAYGGHGERIERPAEVRGALERALDAVGAGRLALVHAVLAPIDPADAP